MTQYRSYPRSRPPYLRRRIRRALHTAWDLLDYVVDYWSYPHVRRAPYLWRRGRHARQAARDLLDDVWALLDESPKLRRLLGTVAYGTGAAALLVFVFYGDGGRG